ncbi:hypothetical protein [Bradyrhizobium aeschynomenes]|nr:hypothetical protein [Bradyrhizobium aeschynomenes]
MTQIANGVAGIDVAKDKVDGCIRKLGVRQIFPSGSLRSEAGCAETSA